MTHASQLRPNPPYTPQPRITGTPDPLETLIGPVNNQEERVSGTTHRTQ